MSPFVPPEPPIEPDAPTPPPSLDTPLPPPEVGFGSPWAPADAENRDRILDWWRMWFRRVFFPWIAAWIAYWGAQWSRIIAYLNEWLEYAGEYIEDHAVNGHSWWKTDTVIDPDAPTVVEIVPFDEFRPILIGDLVSDTSDAVTYGIVTALIDDTHAEVTPLGMLRGLQGFAGLGWWLTPDTLEPFDFTTVTLPVDPTRTPQLNDFVIDVSPASSYGQIVNVISETSVTVAYVGKLQGPAGVAAAGSFQFNTPVLEPEGEIGNRYQGAMADMPQMVGAYVLTVSVPCWIRVYASEAYMLADDERDIMTPLNIADDHGCYLDFVGIPDELTKTLTPGIMFSDIGQGLWLSVVNTNNNPTSIEVGFEYRTFLE